MVIELQNCRGGQKGKWAIVDVGIGQSGDKRSIFPEEEIYIYINILRTRPELEPLHSHLLQGAYHASQRRCSL